MDPLLDGHSTEERIVAAAQLNDQTIRLYIRRNGKVLHRDAEFFPFFFLTDPELLQEFSGQYWLKELAGTNPFRYIVAFTRWSDMWESVQHVLRRYNKVYVPKASSYHEVESLLLRPDPIRQYLAQSGVTLFKSLPFAEIVRAQIEVILRPRGTMRAGDAGIVAWAASATDGSECFCSSQTMQEEEMLTRLVEWIRGTDPDVVEGHFLLDRILPALHNRFEACGVQPLLGRDDRPLRQQTTRGWYASGESERIQFECFGRHVIDTAHLAEQYFAATHITEPVTLASVAHALQIGGAEEMPTAEDLWRRWERDPEDALHALVRRLHGVRQIADHLLPSYAVQTRWCPFNLGFLVQTGIPARLESILFRAYVHAKHSLPRAGAGPPSVSPIAEAYRSGVFRNVLSADIPALFAALIEHHEITPASDQLRVVPQVAVLLRSGAMDADPATAEAARALGAGFHGYFSSGRGLFHDANQADRLEELVRQSLMEFTQQLNLHNAVPLHADPERIYVMPPDNIIGINNEAAFLRRISVEPAGTLSFGNRYASMLCHRRRSFVLLDERNEVRILGSTLVPRTGERFIRRFMLRCVECLLTDDITRLHHTYASFRTMATRHEWTVWDFCRYETIHDDLEEYVRNVNAGTRSPSPAIQAARNAAMYVKPGMRIAYYVVGTHHDVRLADSCRIAGEWDPNLPDENTAYYIQRLDDAANRLREFFDPKDFETIFTLDDLFGFSEHGVKIVQRSLQPETAAVPDADTGEPDDLGIWLADDTPPTVE